MVVQRQTRAIHLGMQQHVARHRPAVDTHAVEVVFVLPERVAGYREHQLVIQIPFPRRLRFIYRVCGPVI